MTLLETTPTREPAVADLLANFPDRTELLDEVAGFRQEPDRTGVVTTWDTPTVC